MRREPFVAARQERWKALETVLADLERRGPAPERVRELPALYRRVCQDLALARHRMYGRELVQHLNRLALLGRERLYRRPASLPRLARDFVASDFPRLVRANGRLFLLSSLLFYGPFALMMLAAAFQPDWIDAILAPEQQTQFEEMYDPANERIGRGRESESDFQMFGFYIWNNVGIAFRTFAWGVLAGVGTVLVLLFNGLFIGAVFAHLTRIGFHSTLFPFAIGHGSFELTAIVLSGVAGLRLGGCVLAPGRHTRTHALRVAGPDCGRLILGAGGMLLVAAFVEGFWSPSGAPAQVKYAVGALLWALVFAYLAFAGRRAGD
jgi:uncharacterized membrane protein SpoIIM required for sporulation